MILNHCDLTQLWRLRVVSRGWEQTIMNHHIGKGSLDFTKFTIGEPRREVTRQIVDSGGSRVTELIFNPREGPYDGYPVASLAERNRDADFSNFMRCIRKCPNVTSMTLGRLGAYLDFGGYLPIARDVRLLTVIATHYPALRCLELHSCEMSNGPCLSTPVPTWLWDPLARERPWVLNPPLEDVFDSFKNLESLTLRSLVGRIGNGYGSIEWGDEDGAAASLKHLSIRSPIGYAADMVSKSQGAFVRFAHILDVESHLDLPTLARVAPNLETMELDDCGDLGVGEPYQSFDRLTGLKSLTLKRWTTMPSGWNQVLGKPLLPDGLESFEIDYHYGKTYPIGFNPDLGTMKWSGFSPRLHEEIDVDKMTGPIVGAG